MEEKMKGTISKILATSLILVALAVTVSANVFSMGSGLKSLETVYVGDIGNAADTTGYGAVNYAYNIGKYEVTTAQYSEFLNAVAATDTYGLYSDLMNNTYGCGIVRSGSSGGYTYSVDSSHANLPVNYISWGDAARFVNWLYNGQPTGSQRLATTEDGVYYLNGATTSAQLKAVAARKTGWTYALPTEDEWYKAAYYKGGTNAGYWDFPTQSDSIDTTKANYNHPDAEDFCLTEVGSFAAYPSAYGTFDQGGNVAEWSETKDSPTGSKRVARGGNQGTAIQVLRSDNRYTWTTTNGMAESPGQGFRIVATVPEPSSLLALVIGAVGLVGFGVRRRR